MLSVTFIVSESSETIVRASDWQQQQSAGSLLPSNIDFLEALRADYSSAVSGHCPSSARYTLTRGETDWETATGLDTDGKMSVVSCFRHNVLGHAVATKIFDANEQKIFYQSK